MVLGSRQIGGSDCGLRVASLRMLALDLWMNSASCSTVSNDDMAVAPVGPVVQMLGLALHVGAMFDSLAGGVAIPDLGS